MALVAQVDGNNFGHLAEFLWAAGGSLALEVIALNNHFKVEHPRALPAKYRSWVFWAVRVLLAVIGGGLAIAENASNPVLAISIGASTPAIMKAFERQPTSREPPKQSLE
jgi:hypothetical protein